MLTLPQCNVVFQDDIFAALDAGALVVVTGETPHATVRISAPDFQARKYVTVDRLTDAAFSRKGNTWTFTGRSAYLAERVGADDATMSVLVSPEPGCADCDA